MLIRNSDLIEASQGVPRIQRGCVVDTNVLFAAAFPLDTFNEWAEGLVDLLHKLEIPLFTNINVRSEFIDLCRRVMIPEGLVGLYNSPRITFYPILEQKLKSLKTRLDKATKDGKTFKLSDNEIKDFRSLLTNYRYPSGENAWDLFCEEFFEPYIRVAWDNATTMLKLQFIGTRAIDDETRFKTKPDWAGAVDIIGKTGIGMADAMIVNLFIHSSLPMLATADRDVSGAILKLDSSVEKRFIVIP